MRFLHLLCVMRCCSLVYSQQSVNSVVADSNTRQILSFVTVQYNNKSFITGLDGRFHLPAVKETATFSHVGYRTVSRSIESISDGDTIFLSPLSKSLQVVIVKSQSEKIRRIINTAIARRALTNPDFYEGYQCNVYYKMTLDVTRYGNYNFDSIRHRSDSITAKRRRGKDTAGKAPDSSAFAREPSYWMMSESVSERLYRKPAKVQETVIASRFSGLKKTYFPNLITGVLPFHIASDFILMNGKEFSNPIAKGWQTRYRFILEDEVLLNSDTVFILSFQPSPGKQFNSLAGLVYINSHGFAVSHLKASNESPDSASKRFSTIEYTSAIVDGRWFPQELNYEIRFESFPLPFTQLIWVGHSRIDNTSLKPPPLARFDRTHPVKIADSVDLYDSMRWIGFRGDTLQRKEARTYVLIDSLAKEAKLESFINRMANLSLGRYSIGKLDIDLNRIIVMNEYEKVRLGIGLYTNNKISKYYSIGGWAGYGFRDKLWKYGSSLMLFPKGNKEQWLNFAMENSYRIPGQVNLHPELERLGLRNWLLEQIEKLKEYSVTGSIRAGYWEMRPSLTYQEIDPVNIPGFDYEGKPVNHFTGRFAAMGFRYAYGEQRFPFFDNYLPGTTKYPIGYLKFGFGNVTQESYKTGYWRVLAAATYEVAINRWGKDNFRLEGGYTKSVEGKPLPRSFLLAGNGYRRAGNNYYTMAGFVTMRPFQYYSDKYISLLYKHDFQKYLYQMKFSKPSLALAHNMIFGSLSKSSQLANNDIQSYGAGYHETGILLNQVLRKNFNFGTLNLDVGYFYHWSGRIDLKNQGLLTAGVSLGL